MSDTKAPEKFELTSGEKLTPLWVRLVTHLEAELQLARVRNDSSRLSERDTAELRGKISALKALIALGDDDRPLTD